MESTHQMLGEETSTTPGMNQEATTICTEDQGCIVDEHVSLDANFKLRIVYLFLGSVGVFGNLFVIIVLLRFKHLRTKATNAFIINQSAIDFLASFFIITTSFLRELPKSGSALTKEVICRIWLTNLPLWGPQTASTYNVVMMTIERYVAIVYPLKPELKITRRRSYALMGTAWFIGIFSQLFYIVPTSVKDNGECSVLTEWVHPTAQMVSSIALFLLQFVIPLVINTFANVRVSYVLRCQAKSSTGAASDNRKEKMALAQRNVMRTLLLVFTFNVACWVWNTVYILIFTLKFVPFVHGFYHFTVMAVFCNSTLNPLVYVIQYQQFQKAAMKMLSCKKKAKNEIAVSAVTDERLQTDGSSMRKETGDSGIIKDTSTQTHL